MSDKSRPGRAPRPIAPAAVEPGGAPRAAGHLAFRVSGLACALPLAAVREVLPVAPSAVPLPDGPPWLLGIFPWRGDLLALIDPAPVLAGAPAGAAPGPPAPDGMGAVVVIGGAGAGVALAVESVAELPPAADEDAPAADGDVGAPIDGRYRAGSLAHARTGERFALLRAEALLAGLIAGLTEDDQDDQDDEDARHG